MCARLLHGLRAGRVGVGLGVVGTGEGDVVGDGLVGAGDDVDVAGGAGAGGAAVAVGPGGFVDGDVVVYDRVDAGLEVEAAGGEVGGDEHAGHAGAHFRHGYLALALVEAAVVKGGGDAASRERLYDALGALAVVDEDDGRAGLRAAQQRGQRVEFVADGRGHLDDGYAHGLAGGGGEVYRLGLRHIEVRGPLVGGGGRRQDAHTRGAEAGEDAAHLVLKSQRENFVELVDDESARRLHRQRAAADVVEQTPRSAYKYLWHRPAQRVGLALEATSAVHRHHAAVARAETLQHVADLDDELARRSDDDGLQKRVRGDGP